MNGSEYGHCISLVCYCEVRLYNFYLKEWSSIKTIYKFKNSKEETIALYNNQLSKLNCEYNDIYVKTSFGETHIVETGNFDGAPLLVFHGGNSTTAYNLLSCSFLLKDFHIYAVDIIGHPGKSADVSLSPRGYNYGKWASEVIDGLNIKKLRCIGVSFGGGILAKLMCVAPDKIEKSVLIVPSGINNAFPISTTRMMIPLLKFLKTKEEKYITQTALFMAITEDVIDLDTIDTLKNSFEHIRTKVGMPSNISRKLIKGCLAPTFVIASELDCLFPAKKVLKRAREIFQNCSTYELKDRGHMHLLTDKEKQMIVDFLR